MKEEWKCALIECGEVFVPVMWRIFGDVIGSTLITIILLMQYANN
jgi:hypothetical protein